MVYEKIIDASRFLYCKKPMSPEEIARTKNIEKDRIEKVQQGLDMYTKPDSDIEAIAQQTGLELNLVASVLKEFVQLCRKAYSYYQNSEKEFVSIAGAAETCDINRWYFEDFFWRKMHLCDERGGDEGKECLARIDQELAKLRSYE